jgi:uncharacterized protein (TIGR02996 family)
MRVVANVKTRPPKRVARQKAAATSAGAAALVDDAHAALVAGDAARALALLLDAWRETPDATLADAIELVGARAAHGVHAPAGRTDTERERAWLKAAKAGDPVMRHVLLATITDGQVQTRLAALAAVRDPRVAAKLADLIEVPFRSPTRDVSNVWTPVFELLVDCGDSRVVTRAAKFPAAWEAHLEYHRRTDRKAAVARITKAVQQLAAAMPRPAPELPSVARARVAEIGKLAAAPSATASTDQATEAALLAAVRAAPDDDGPRAIYGDWLQERGDPRGEFIALQLAKQRRSEWGRADDLHEQHRERWLGSLASYVTSRTLTRFERGFLASAELDDVRPPPDPAWATVHTIRGGMPATDECPMPALREATELDSHALEQLAALSKTPPLERLGWRDTDGEWSATSGYSARTRSAISAFARLALPKLRSLALLGSKSWVEQRMRPDQLEWPWQATPIVELAVTANMDQLDAWLRAVVTSPLQRLELQHGAGEYPEWRLVLARDKRGQLSQLTVTHGASMFYFERALEAIAAALERMDADQLTSFALSVHKRHWTLPNRQRLARALDHQRRVKPEVPGFERPRSRGA